MIPWFKVKIDGRVFHIRSEPGGCGIRWGFRCYHGNSTVHRFLWEFANNKSVETIKIEIMKEFKISEALFDESLAETNAILKNLGLITRNLEDSTYVWVKAKRRE